MTIRKVACAVLCLCQLLASAGNAEPAEGCEDAAQNIVSELRGGVLAHDVDHLWSGFRRENGIDWNGEIVFYRPGLPILWGRLRPMLGASINSRGDTSKAYAGALWELEWSTGIFFSAGLSAAIHDGRLDSRTRKDQKELGTRVLFRTSFDLGYSFNRHHRLMATFAHVSNASRADPNQGLDTVGARYGFRF